MPLQFDKKLKQAKEAWARPIKNQFGEYKKHVQGENKKLKQTHDPKIRGQYRIYIYEN
jgi:hypothetical protein